MKKILILGGGFSGIYTAKNLQKENLKDFEIELISDNNYFIFQPLLPEVASGTIYSSDAVTPIRQMLKGIKYRNAEISNLDLKNKKVSILQGFKKSSHDLNYDHYRVSKDTLFYGTFFAHFYSRRCYGTFISFFTFV